MPRVVEVEQLLGEIEEAAPRLAQPNERHRVELQERHVFGELELPAIVLEVRGLQRPQVVLKLLPRQQALLQAVPVAERDVAGAVEAELEPQAALGPLR